MSDRAQMPSSYDDDLAREPSDTCEMDGYTESYTLGREVYWHCGKEAAATITVTDTGGTYQLRVCAEHAEDETADILSDPETMQAIAEGESEEK